MPSLNIEITANSINAATEPLAEQALVQREVLRPGSKKASKLRKMLFFFALFFGLCAVSWVYYDTNIQSAENSVIGGINDTVQGFVAPELKQDKDGYTNFLLVGKDTREFSQTLQNTDSIVVGSYNNKTKEVTLISIPRDTWVKYPISQTYFRRINGVYAYGEQQVGEGEGMKMLSDVAEDVTGLEIHYWAMVDLAGFVEAIDILGGVDIDVERSFTDYSFPADRGIGYRTVRFEEGLQHMDGQTALDYARSRKAAGPEGSDYARARRQQRLLKAVLDKVLAYENLDLDKVLELKSTVDKNVQYSPIDTEDINAGLYQMKSFDSEKITSVVLDPTIGGGGYVTTADRDDTGGAFALIPYDGYDEWDDIHKLIEGIINDPALYRENPTIYIYDGGLGYNKSAEKADDIAEEFESLAITYGGYNQADNVDNVVIFVSEEKTETLKRVKKFLENKGHKVTIVRELEGFRPRFGEDLSIIFGKPVTEGPQPQEGG